MARYGVKLSDGHQEVIESPSWLLAGATVMYLTFGTGMQVEGYEYDRLCDVFETCCMKDREALAAWLMEVEPDRCGEIGEALCGAFPLGPEPAPVA